MRARPLRPNRPDNGSGQPTLTVLARLRRRPPRLDAVEDRFCLRVDEHGRAVQTRRERPRAPRRDGGHGERERGQLVERLRQVRRVVEAHDAVGAARDQRAGPRQRPQRVFLGWVSAQRSKASSSCGLSVRGDGGRRRGSRRGRRREVRTSDNRRIRRRRTRTRGLLLREVRERLPLATAPAAELTIVESVDAA